jgi:hypothetical protein
MRNSHKTIALLGCLALLNLPVPANAQTAGGATNSPSSSGSGTGPTGNPTAPSSGYSNDTVSPGTGVPMGTSSAPGNPGSYNSNAGATSNTNSSSVNKPTATPRHHHHHHTTSTGGSSDMASPDTSNMSQ